MLLCQFADPRQLRMPLEGRGDARQLLTILRKYHRDFGRQHIARASRRRLGQHELERGEIGLGIKPRPHLDGSDFHGF
ncbi:hypothetical protein D3C87_2135080 [compost metagenome]